MKKECIRIWVYWHRRYVKITLPANKPVTLEAGGRHEEGWWHRSETFEYQPDFELIERSVSEDSTDCDGRHGHYQDLECITSKAHSREPCQWLDNIYQGWELKEKIAGQEGVMLPEWEEKKARVYDQFAEKMGY